MVSVKQKIHTTKLGGAEVHVQTLKDHRLHNPVSFWRRQHILHTHLPRWNILGMFSRARHKVCSVHNVYDKGVRWRGRNVQLPLAIAAWKRADAVVAITQHVKEWLIECGVDESKIQIIRYGVPVPTNSTTTSGKMLVGSIGRLEPRKGHDRLILQMPQVRAEHPHAQLHIVGRDDRGYRKTLEALIRRYSLGSSVKLLGELSHQETMNFLDGITVYAQASRAEGLGLTVLEAMAHGKPVYVTDIPSFKEIVPEWWRTYHWQELGPRLAHRLGTPDLCRETGLALKQHVITNFSVQAMIDKHRRLYESL